MLARPVLKRATRDANTLHPCRTRMLRPPAVDMSHTLTIRRFFQFLIALIPALIVACGDGAPPYSVQGYAPTGNFALAADARSLTLDEGDAAGIDIALSLQRLNQHSLPVALQIEPMEATGMDSMSADFSQPSFSPGADNSNLNLSLAIGVLPILPEQRRYLITATDGVDNHRLVITVNVRPTTAPDVYLLAGQSNMVGFSGDGTKRAFVGGPDEPHPRIFQLNATENDQYSIFSTKAAFTSLEANAKNPLIVQAEDPLHVPSDPNNSGGKELEYIGLGLSFAKSALNDTSGNIILVPAAWSGSAFCANEDGPIGQWNARASTNPALGNTWLFDRAVARTNTALTESRGILRGILWHQGESDANDNCASSYAENLAMLATELRTRIVADVRGIAFRGPDAKIPFVLGTMSRGSDENGDIGDFSDAKTLIDMTHRDLPGVLPFTDLSNHDDLLPQNGYPCGNTTCVHFGAEALRLAGSRYYEALKRAALKP